MGYLLAALAGSLLFFNSQATPNKAAQVMETALRKQFPQAQVDVDITGKRGLNVVNGKFKTVRVQMSGFGSSGGAIIPIQAVRDPKKAGRIGQMSLQLRDFELNGLNIESADIAWSNVVYDFNSLKKDNKLQLAGAAPGTARITVSAASLQTLLARQSQRYYQPQIVVAKRARSAFRYSPRRRLSERPCRSRFRRDSNHAMPLKSG
jgi:hypothetical protein